MPCWTTGKLIIKLQPGMDLEALADAAAAIEMKYFAGQFLYYLADLQRVNYPGAGSGVSFLPWNQLYDVRGKLIDYVRSFSESIFDPYDPYLGE